MDRMTPCEMYTPTCEKNFDHHMHGLRIITFSSLHVCVDNTNCMHVCTYDV